MIKIKVCSFGVSLTILFISHSSLSKSNSIILTSFPNTFLKLFLVISWYSDAFVLIKWKRGSLYFSSIVSFNSWILSSASSSSHKSKYCLTRSSFNLKQPVYVSGGWTIILCEKSLPHFIKS